MKVIATFSTKLFVYLLIHVLVLSCSKHNTEIDSPRKVNDKAEDLSSSLDITQNQFARNTPDNKGSVASVNPIATQAGLDVFSRGGNAIDAALAVAFTLGVVDSHNSGIGGGCFILVRTANGDILAIDGREMAPSLAHRDMYIQGGKAKPHLSQTGALAVGIPGSVAAFELLQNKYGKLGFKDVLLLAAEIAEKGFPIDKVLAARLSRTQESIRLFPATSQVFLPNNNLLNVGDKLIQLDLAKTYRKLAERGAAYFYRGEFAEQTAQWMAANGGIINKKDFENYNVVLREPVHSTFSGYDVYGFPTPSSGGIHVNQILTMLDGYDLSSLSTADRYHRIIETLKLAFADRAYWLGDADYVSVPKGLVDRDYLSSRASTIDMSKASEVKHGMPPNHNTDVFNDRTDVFNDRTDVFDKHTTHIATADALGNWVAITTTLNTSFGSKVMVPDTGVLLNNQMDDFSAQPGMPNAFGLIGAEANSIAPGKRPLSSMSPTIITKSGKPVLTVGAAGGPTIISQVVMAIIHHLELGMSLERALAAVRVHHQWLPDRVFIDDFADEQLQKALQERGHQITLRSGFGATQAIGLKSTENGFVFDPQAEPRIQ